MHEETLEIFQESNHSQRSKQHYFDAEWHTQMDQIKTSLMTSWIKRLRVNLDVREYVRQNVYFLSNYEYEYDQNRRPYMSTWLVIILNE